LSENIGKEILEGIILCCVKGLDDTDRGHGGFGSTGTNWRCDEGRGQEYTVDDDREIRETSPGKEDRMHGWKIRDQCWTEVKLDTSGGMIDQDNEVKLIVNYMNEK
jgi:hypothetical protein